MAIEYGVRFSDVRSEIELTKYNYKRQPLPPTTIPEEMRRGNRRSASNRSFPRRYAEETIACTREGIICAVYTKRRDR